MPALAVGLIAPAELGDLATGLALLGGGVAMWIARPDSRAGALALLAGVAWFLGDVTTALLYVHRGPLVHLVLTYPSGRTRSRAAWVVIALAYADGLVPELARAEWPTILLALAVVGVAARRRAAGIERRARTAALVAAAAVASALVLAAVARLAGVESSAALVWLYEVAVISAAAILTAELRLGSRATVTGLVVDLGDRAGRGGVRGALARTLGDPSLQVAFRVRDEWVDEAGRPLRLPADVTMTALGDGVAIAHDPAAMRDPALAEPVAAAVRLAVATAGLQADVAGRVAEVEASRRRLVEAADEERRRLGAALRAGPERRLASVQARLEALEGPEVARLAGELAEARGDVARFAAGVHPRALTDGGLRAALSLLAQQAAGPVTIDAPAARFAPAQEAAVYFVCSEALANVAKYAPAARTVITVAARNERLVVTIADDGPGGADASRGTGLRGLADRVEALGGTLGADSPPGAGTRLIAELPA